MASTSTVTHGHTYKGPEDLGLYIQCNPRLRATTAVPGFGSGTRPSRPSRTSLKVGLCVSRSCGSSWVSFWTSSVMLLGVLGRELSSLSTSAAGGIDDFGMACDPPLRRPTSQLPHVCVRSITHSGLSRRGSGKRNSIAKARSTSSSVCLALAMDRTKRQTTSADLFLKCSCTVW